MDPLLARTATVIFLVAATMALFAPGATAPDRFDAVHWDSRTAPDGPGGVQRFEEVFKVTAVRGPDVAPQNLEILLDGDPLTVAWEDTDGVLGPGDTFSFFLPTEDITHHLEARLEGMHAWGMAFGPGAGTPVP